MVGVARWPDAQPWTDDAYDRERKWRHIGAGTMSSVGACSPRVREGGPCLVPWCSDTPATNNPSPLAPRLCRY